MSPAKPAPKFIPRPHTKQGVLMATTLPVETYLQLSERAKHFKIKETEFARQAIIFAMAHMPGEGRGSR